ncbi:hypothetical protein KAH55_12080 [bacterium]|nr:hypothetical protein [bacterium]
MRIEVVPVTTRRQLRSFIQFPYKLYKNHPCWVPPIYKDEWVILQQDKNPAFAHCKSKYWLAYQNGKIVGRIAGIINELHRSKWNQPYVRFGWFDFVDDIDVSRALLHAVESWAREQGMAAVHGPLGFTDLDQEGMLVDGFDQLGTIVTIYNHPYYPKHLEKIGYEKDIDWVEYEIDVPETPDGRIARIARIALRRNHLKVPVIKKKKQLLRYVDELFDVLDEAYAHLYGMVPLTRKQVESYTRQYFGLINPDFVPFVTDENDRLIAFGIVLPSLSTALQKCGGRLFPFGFIHLLYALRKNDRADLYLIGVRKAYQGKGVNAILIDQINGIFNKMGITKVESNPELETNHQVQDQWKFFHKRQHKRRRVFIKHLT